MVRAGYLRSSSVLSSLPDASLISARTILGKVASSQVRPSSSSNGSTSDEHSESQTTSDAGDSVRKSSKPQKVS